MTQISLSIIRTFKETDQRVEFDLDVEGDIHPEDKSTGIGPSVDGIRASFYGEPMELTEKEMEGVGEMLISNYLDELADGPDPDAAYERAKDEGCA